LPELQTALEQHLDPDLDPSPTIRTVFGLYLPRLWYLDEAWTKSNFQGIFPTSGPAARLGRQAWATYVQFNRPYPEVLAVGRTQYEEAVEQVGQKSNGEITDVERRLTDHIMELQIMTDDATDLRQRFFGKARLELRSHALEFIGFVMKQGRLADDPGMRARLQHLWEDRVQAEASGDTPLQELAAFGAWFAASYFDESWSLGHLASVLGRGCVLPLPSEVVARLASVSEDNLLVAVGCLAMIVESDRDEWGVISWRDKGHELLSRGIRSSDPRVREASRSVVSRLLLAGHQIPFADLAR